ncbi:lysoplasmalogenase [Streptomyces sp. NPDC049813]|uniref:lysoplasmalogenase n=1 Tax=Streptomyces sp. NPDC049813 TaxID=3365597 RepID=UPI0037B26CEF
MTLPRALRATFLVVCAVDLGALLAGADTAHTVAKPLLMPLLAAYVAARGGPRLLCAALLCGWGGDVLLLFDQDAAFLAGMACFAAGHGCYLVLFRRHGTPRARGALLAVAYCVALAATLAFLWPGLPGEMRGPVAGYSVLLTAMAYGACRVGPVAGTGGALFLLSDTLIAAGIADRPQPPCPGFWVMATYMAAQYLLARGVLGERAAPEAAYRERSAAIRHTPL